MLTIIGMVAALAIPTLLSKYQEQANVNKLKNNMFDEQAHIQPANALLPYLKVKENCLRLTKEEIDKKCGIKDSTPLYNAHVVLENGTKVLNKRPKLQPD